MKSTFFVPREIMSGPRDGMEKFLRELCAHVRGKMGGGLISVSFVDRKYLGGSALHEITISVTVTA